MSESESLIKSSDRKEKGINAEGDTHPQFQDPKR